MSDGGSVSATGVAGSGSNLGVVRERVEVRKQPVRFVDDDFAF